MACSLMNFREIERMYSQVGFFLPLVLSPSLGRVGLQPDVLVHVVPVWHCPLGGAKGDPTYVILFLGCVSDSIS